VRAHGVRYFADWNCCGKSAARPKTDPAVTRGSKLRSTTMFLQTGWLMSLEC
jgi:hypothetical protein